MAVFEQVFVPSTPDLGKLDEAIRGLVVAHMRAHPEEDPQKIIGVVSNMVGQLVACAKDATVKAAMRECAIANLDEGAGMRANPAKLSS